MRRYNERCEPPWTEKELIHKVREAMSKSTQPKGFLLNAKSFNEIQSRKVEWLWKPWIPLGKVTVIDGDPGLGKSTVIIDIAAKASVAGTAPCGIPLPKTTSIILSAEDAADDTIKPRIEAAGGDPERIYWADDIKDGKSNRPIEFPKDIGAIRNLIAETEAGILIIDPIMAFLGNVDANKDQSIRKLLYAFSNIANDFRCAVIIMRHLNKSPGSKAIYRGNTSIAVIGHARSGIVIAEDPDDTDKRVMAISKTNIAKKPPSLSYSLKEEESGVCKVIWNGETHWTADELVTQDIQEEVKDYKANEKSKLFIAIDILKDLLSEGPASNQKCKAECALAGVSQRTTERAAKKLGVILKVEKTPTGSKYLWALPVESEEEHPEQSDGKPEPMGMAAEDAPLVPEMAE